MKPFKSPTRFTKRMMLLLVLLACGLSSYADGYTSEGIVEINGVKYHLYDCTWSLFGTTSTIKYAYVEEFTGTSTEIVIPKTIKNGSTSYSVAGLRYKPTTGTKTATLSSSYVQTIRFEGSISLYPGSNYPTFNCPNLRYIYFEGASPSFSDLYESYFASPAKKTLTVYLSDKTAQEIATMTTSAAVWSDFLHVYPLPNSSVKRNVNLSISRARVQIGDNYYVNDKALQVDMNSDLTFKVFKGYDTYRPESVMLNGMDILGEMEYTEGGADYLSYYTYTLPNITSDAYITVTGVNTKYEVNVICNNGGTITSPHANTSVIIPNSRASIRWFKADGDTNMTIIPNEGYTLDKLYYNSYDNTYRATANADGTFTYPLTADADISVVFKEIDPTIDWNVTLMGNVSVTAQFMDKRGAWASFKDIVAGTNTVIDNAQRMNMTIVPPENATGTLVVLADGVDLSSYFTTTWSWDYERECYSTEEAQESIPAEYLKATDWVIGVKASDSDSFVWTLKAVGEMGASTVQMVVNSGNQTWNVSSDERIATNVVPGITRLNHSLTIQLASHYSFTASFNGTDYTTSFVAGTVADGKVPYTFNMALGEPENAGMLVDGTWTITFTEESTENIIEWTAMAVGDVAEGLQSASFSLDDDLILVMLSQNSQSESDTYPIEESSGQIGFYIGASVFVHKGCDFRVWFNGTECTDKFIKQGTTSNNIETWYFTSNNASIVAPYATSGTWVVEFKEAAKTGLTWDAFALGEVTSGNSMELYMDDDLMRIKISNVNLKDTCYYEPIDEGVTGYEFYGTINVLKDYSFRVLFNGVDCTNEFVKQNTTYEDKDVWKFISTDETKLSAYAVDGTWVIEFKKADDIIQFADANVKAICVDNWDTDGDGELSKAEAAAVTTLIDGTTNKSVFYNKKADITSFDEFQYFTGLTKVEKQAFYVDSIRSVILPPTITSIEEDAFYKCRIHQIDLPEGITSIGKNAFSNCVYLENIVLPKSLTSIEGFAFASTSIRQILIPENVNSITPVSGANIFSGCRKLSSIAVDEKNAKFDSRNNCSAIIQKTASGGTLIYGCKNSIIPDGVTRIWYQAFSNAGIKKMVIPSSVTTIYTAAFAQNTLDLLVMKRETPITFNKNMFTMSSSETTPASISNCVLVVPVGTKDAYATAGWKSIEDGGCFKEVVEEVKPAYFDVNGDGEINVTDVTSLVNKILHP